MRCLNYLYPKFLSVDYCKASRSLPWHHLLLNLRGRGFKFIPVFLMIYY
jgi:hypothetical protein